MNPAAQTADKQLKQLLAELVALARQHGPDSEQVRALVQENADVADFKELAAALLLVVND